MDCEPNCHLIQTIDVGEDSNSRPHNACTHESSDADLVASVGTGDLIAWELLLARHAEELNKHASRLLAFHNIGDQLFDVDIGHPQDFVTDSILEAVKKWDPKRSSLITFCKWDIRGNIIDNYRVIVRRRIRMDPIDGPGDSSAVDDSPMVERIPNKLQLEEDMLENIYTKLIWQKLSDRCNFHVYMATHYHVEWECTDKEIGDKLNLTAGTARNRWKRGVKMLKEIDLAEKRKMQVGTSE